MKRKEYWPNRAEIKAKEKAFWSLEDLQARVVLHDGFWHQAVGLRDIPKMQYHKHCMELLTEEIEEYGKLGFGKGEMSDLQNGVLD